MPDPQPWEQMEAREGWWGDEEAVVYPADAVDATLSADQAEIARLRTTRQSIARFASGLQLDEDD